MNKDSLKFDEDTHTYESNGKKLVSVTKLIHKYTDDFDADVVIDKMIGDNSIYLGKKKEYLGLNKEEIKKLWKINSKGKSTYGTFIHDFAEKYALFKQGKLDEPSIPDLAEAKQVIRFFKKEGYEIIETEMRIFSERLGIAGTVDLLLKKDNLYYIADWKTCIGKDLSDSSGTKWTRMCKEPIDNVPSLEFWKYSLQMSVYRYILENTTQYFHKVEGCDGFPMNFGESFIIHLVRSQDDLKDKFGKRVIYPEMNRITYKKIETPFMKDEVESVILHHRDNMKK